MLRVVRDLHRAVARRHPRLDSGGRTVLERVRSLAADRGERRRVFELIYRENLWGDDRSRSGPGSTLEDTAAIRAALPPLLERLGVRSLLDVPCGDFSWMSHVPLDLEYYGGDIVPELVDEVRRRYGGPRRRFALVDVVRGPLPRVDLVLCRDCLVHLSFADARRALRAVRASGSTYLLTTTFWDRSVNRDIRTGAWRPLDLTLPPFSFGPPLELIDERCALERWPDKGLGLWRVADLPAG